VPNQQIIYIRSWFLNKKDERQRIRTLSLFAITNSIGTTLLGYAIVCDVLIFFYIIIITSFEEIYIFRKE
jgi:hypothetical protein